MATPAGVRAPQSPTSPARTFGNGYLFGVPVRDLGWFSSLLTSFSLGFVTFFLVTFLAIVWFLFANSSGHPMDYSLTYRHFGLPAGILMTVISLAYLGMLWTRRILRR